MWGRLAGVDQVAATRTRWSACARGLALLFALVAVRAAVGLYPHSGQSEAPMFGDYEAHRHWMALTLALPPALWYQEEAHPPVINPMGYWGIDYPPGSAWWSLLWAWPLARVEPDMMLEPDGRGFETPLTKTAMRMTVVGSDLLVFMPAVLLYVSTHVAPRFRTTQALFLGLLPALILIDHAHFQYNSVSLGFSLLAVTFALAERGSNKETLSHAAAAAFYTQAVFFKHLCIYYVPAIGGFLLSRSFHLYQSRGFFESLQYALAILFAIATNSVILLAPWIAAGPQSLIQIGRRLFPMYRGLYEDKVANFWCTVTLFLKVRDLITPTLCALATLIAAAPFTVLAFHAANETGDPSHRRELFLVAMSGSSLSFYLFAFQVHEKQVLLPLLPMALLLPDYPTLAHWFSYAASFSMFPLLDREGSSIAYVSMLVIQSISQEYTVLDLHPRTKGLFIFSALGALSIHLVSIFGPAVHRYPDLYVYLFTIYSCGHFLLLYTVLAYQGYTLFLNERRHKID